MKVRVSVLALAVASSTVGAEESFKKAFERALPRGTFMVLLTDGIPTSSVAIDAEGVDVRDGELKRAKGFFDPGFSHTLQDILARGEVVKIDGVAVWQGALVKKNRVDILVETVDLRTNKAFGTFNAAAHTLFKFHFPFPVKTAEDVPRALDYIAGHLRVVASEREARALSEELRQPITKKVTAGQTREDVQRVLGPPEKTIELAEKEVWVYSGLKVIFKAGRVVDVE